MTWWDELVERDRRLLEYGGQKAGQAISALPESVKSAGQTAFTALNAPLTGWGGLIALGQGRGLQEAAAGIEEGKTAGQYLMEAIPEPQYKDYELNLLQELARQGAGLATDVGVGAIGPLEMGMAGAKGAKAILPVVIDSFSSGGGRTLGRSLGRASERGSVYIPGPVQKEIPLASPWFSRTEQLISEKVPSRADPQQIKNILAQGAPKEEVEWRGLNEYLVAQKGPVAKEDVLKQLKENPVNIGEVVKGGIKEVKPTSWYENQIRMTERAAQRAQAMDLPDEAERLFREAENLTLEMEKASGLGVTDPGLSPKFANYATPGGKNYREVLMTLPSKKKGIGDLMEGETLIDALERGQKENPVFKSSHWSEPNVLAHIRMSDFSDEAGRKTLLIDEIQSDWHQKGRKEGYTNKAELGKKINALKLEREDVIGKRAKALDNPDEYDRLHNKEMEIINEMNSLASQQKSGVPDAPFKKNWHELAFKRALKEAVDGGYDQLAWTKGAQQAERYSLSKHVKEIDWEKTARGTYNVYPTDLKGGPVSGAKVLEGNKEQISNIFGKEIADKIVNNPKNHGYLSGVDLQVGGEGMKGFYDEMLPSYANKYLKKYGAKVETAKLPGGQEVHSIPITPEMRQSIQTKGQSMWQVPAAVGLGAAGAGSTALTDEDQRKILGDIIRGR
jgi:hypothetical protein